MEASLRKIHMKIFSRFNNKGFTLIELLAVIAIIAILAALGLASYTRAQMSARNSRAIGNVKAYQNAMEQYYAQNQNYGTGSGGQTAANCPGTGATALGQYFSAGVPTTVTRRCNSTSYTICTTEALEGTQRGANASNNTGGNLGTGTTHFCATNLQ